MELKLTNLLTELKRSLIDDRPERFRGIQGGQEIRRILKIYEGVRKAHRSKEIARFLAGREELGKELDSISRKIIKKVERYNNLKEYIKSHINPFLSDFLSEEEKKRAVKERNELRRLSAKERTAIYELEIDIKNFEKKKAEIEEKIKGLEGEKS